MGDATTRARPDSGQIKIVSDLPAGTVVGAYVIEALQASGGHGLVFRARHLSSGKLVAIKVLHPALLTLPRMAERFLREVEVILRLYHPNIVEVYELGALPDGTPYYVMEYLTGTTLRAYLRERGRVSPEQALAILEPICAALTAAHAAGIVHRDVKPGNIMISDGEPRVVKLLDFGIAKLVAPEEGQPGLTASGQQLGTPAIMAPEQILCGPIDARTDIYALGALLYNLLTGRPPFESTIPGDLVQQHLEAPPPRPSQRVPLGPALDSVVLRCLEKRPERRFETVGAFLSALREAVVATSAVAQPAEAERRALGVFVEIRVREDDDDEADDEMLAHVVRILERAEECMKSGGFVLATTTSTQVLGLRLLSDDQEYNRVERRSAMEFALTLHAALQKDAPDDTRLHVNVAVHADAVTVRLGAEPEIASGAIARTDQWVPRQDIHGLCATSAAIEGLDELDVETGPDEVTIVRRRGEKRKAMPSQTAISGAGERMPME
jgi:serine/threonine-protein kinase